MFSKGKRAPQSTPGFGSWTDRGMSQNNLPPIRKWGRLHQAEPQQRPGLASQILSTLACPPAPSIGSPVGICRSGRSVAHKPAWKRQPSPDRRSFLVGPKASITATLSGIFQRGSPVTVTTRSRTHKVAGMRTCRSSSAPSLFDQGAGDTGRQPGTLTPCVSERPDSGVTPHTV